MKVIKNINNNVSHCTDSRGREVIVFGKGVGFFKPGDEIPLAQINRTFYNVKDTDFGIIRQIPTAVITTAITIVDYASEKLSVTFPSSSAIALADHLQFAIDRHDQNIYLPQPLLQDIAQLYPDEMDVAMDCLKIIEKMTGTKLPRQEAGTIAMHFINDAINTDRGPFFDTSVCIDKVTEIIESRYQIALDRDSFNYSRFVTHLDYLIRRLINKEQIQTRNEKISEEMRNSYPDSYTCAEGICRYLKKELHEDINEEE
ncbi:MAG: PRD domain-containing protein, partial [Erysipelotrichaceae bacterium]|nr:PRD domain-containing protein [Erysipelotrichaceae bacterium]